jgi:hypothetical protein
MPRFDSPFPVLAHELRRRVRESRGMDKGRRVGRALARQRKKLARAKALIESGMRKKDAAAKVGWSAAHLRALLSDEQKEMERLA